MSLENTALKILWASLALTPMCKHCIAKSPFYLMPVSKLSTAIFSSSLADMIYTEIGDCHKYVLGWTVIWNQKKNNIKDCVI